MEREEAVVVAGAACRLPGASTPTALWQLLREGRTAIREVPAERWSADAYFDADLATPGKINNRVGGFIDNIAGFDPAFFGISKREAEALDPQHRLLLEVSWEALENAYVPPTTLAGSRSGVFIGIGNSDYASSYYSREGAYNAYSPSGNILCFSANRLSRFYDLRGPSMAIDTACSSSMYALHYACQGLRAGDIDWALVGGVSLLCEPSTSIAMSKAGLLSSLGEIRSYDATADGLVRSDGCVVMLLTRSGEAQARGVTPLGIVAGTAVAHDGGRGALTAPDLEAQQDVMRSCLERAKIRPEDISYVEGHGVGSPLADGIELQAFQSVFCKSRKNNAPLLVSSMKPNIGHSEAASGLASVLKALLCLKNGQIPAVLHFKELNPAAGHVPGLKVLTENTLWSPGWLPNVSVNSYGIGGANGNAVIRGVDR